MRGTALIEEARSIIRRFIPAYAGNRNRSKGPENPPPVHPRVCGEQSTVRTTSARSSGSSPRMRGTGLERHRHAGWHRFIPAYAGNSRSRPLEVGPRSVHPRVCGEQALNMPPSTSLVGSSPRMRGTVSHLARIVFKRRFIPAYAGNRSQATPISSASPVHPRVCGEQFAASLAP